MERISSLIHTIKHRWNLLDYEWEHIEKCLGQLLNDPICLRYVKETYGYGLQYENISIMNEREKLTLTIYYIKHENHDRGNSNGTIYLSNDNIKIFLQIIEDLDYKLFWAMAADDMLTHSQKIQLLHLGKSTEFYNLQYYVANMRFVNKSYSVHPMHYVIVRPYYVKDEIKVYAKSFYGTDFENILDAIDPKYVYTENSFVVIKPNEKSLVQRRYGEITYYKKENNKYVLCQDESLLNRANIYFGMI